MRHENKYFINYADYLALRAALQCVALPDKHAISGSYTIRSLYFDNFQDKALLESKNGYSNREKFRIRCYNYSLNPLILECKVKNNSLGYKKQENISENQLNAILQGDFKVLQQDKRPLLQEFYLKIQRDGLKPVCVVEYDREPYIYEYGNVRVTFDSNIKTTTRIEDFIDFKSPILPVIDDPILLEVKWDNYLPDLIAKAVNRAASKRTAFSKYATCRFYD